MLPSPRVCHSSTAKACTTLPMAFIDSIPTNIQGLSRLAAVNDKVLKPGLSVAQTAKGYVNTMRKDKTQNQTHTIVIDTLSRRETSASDRSDPIDHEYTDTGKEQRQRVQQLMNTRSLNPPFPNDLPDRPQKKKQPMNRWKVGFSGLCLLFVAAVIPLSILAARVSSPDCDPNQRGQQSQATVTATTTRTSLLTLTTTRRTTSVSTYTDVVVRTTIITDVPKSTGLGAAKDGAKME